MTLHINTFAVGPFQSNCSILTCPKTGITAIIDPGGDAHMIAQNLNDEKASPSYILITHAHIDHIHAIGDLRSHLKNPSLKICLHKRDHALYQNLKQQGKMFGIHAESPPAVNHFIEDGNIIKLGETQIRVLWTPGHSPGSVCFFISDPPILFSGDTLFFQGVGRTDLWEGSYETLAASIREKLFCLPDTTKVICGHGPSTTIGDEKQSNPFVGGG